ncbi:hypothetical protein B7760_01779 [Burkholderia glumae]|uniref:hypothetical protein n=1 Tax=Burkholderia glumae TaxID=337 RepID=UPI00157A81A2|nr:hypothetical protein [Burkholderia glumae]QKM47755.1 hypothetical protein B7760_01779 [Burkholderia glumae]
MSDKLSDALAKYNSMMDHLGGCSDGGCVIKRPAGMHTNGGCRCPKDAMKMQRAMYVANGLRDAVSAFLAPSPAPAIPAELRAEIEWCATEGNAGPRTRALLERLLKAAPAISESEDTKRLDWLTDRLEDAIIDGADPEKFLPDDVGDGNEEGAAACRRAWRLAIDAARKGEKP